VPLGGIDITLRIGEPDLVTKLLKLELEQAKELKSQDADENGINTGLKAWFPSTVLAYIGAHGRLIDVVHTPSTFIIESCSTNPSLPLHQAIFEIIGVA
jgi:hypothetical protein